MQSRYDQHHPPRPSPALRLAALRLRSRFAADAFLAALDRYHALRTKEFNPDQPRVPPGSPEGGQWTNGEAGGGGWPVFDLGPIDLGPIELAPLAAAAGIGHNCGPSLDEPPQIPKQDPGDQKTRLQRAKDAAKWLAKFGARRIPVVAGVVVAVEAAQWLRAQWPSIRSYRDKPATYDELVKGAREARPGYHGHHVVEQQSANDGIPRSMIEGPRNVVSVPIYKHREISAWYQTKSKLFGYQSPRDYLRGKSWNERQRVGEYALRKHEVLIR
jgi:hypothetical protein